MKLVMRLAQRELLVLAQVVDVDVSVGLHPVLVGFEGQRPDEAQAAFGVGEDELDIGAPADFLVEAFQHVGNRYDHDGAIRSPLEMIDFRRMVRPSGTGAPGVSQVRAGRSIR